MCISAAVVAGASLLAASAQAVSSITTANTNKVNAIYEDQVRQKQLNEKRQIEQLAAMERENARSAEYEEFRSRAFAAMGDAGVENISFFQGVGPESQQAYGRDVRNIRLGLTAEQASIADQIQVSGMRRKVDISNANSAKIGAFAEFTKSAANAYNFYSSYKKG